MARHSDAELVHAGLLILRDTLRECLQDESLTLEERKGFDDDLRTTEHLLEQGRENVRQSE